MLLDRVNAYLAANMMTDFSGSFMILAEWRDVHPYPHGSSYFFFYQIYYPTISDFANQVLYMHSAHELHYKCAYSAFKIYRQ